MAESNAPMFDSQIVSYLLALYAFHNAEPGTQDAFTLYDQLQKAAAKPSSIGGGPALPALGHALAGSVATAASKVLLYPLDLVITRLQVQQQLHGPKEAPSAAQDADADYANVIDAAQKIYKNEGGLKAFYTGCAPDIAKGIADSFLFFLGYSFLRQRELRKQPGAKSLPVVNELAVGVAAGAFAKLITTPLQNIITRQQTAALVAARDPTSSTTPGGSDKLSIRDIAHQIRSERGIQGFWAGYSASIILTLNPSITFAVDNLLRRGLLRGPRENANGYSTFLIAAISKVIATSITYPVSLAKSRAQVSSPSSVSEEEGTTEGAPPKYLEKPNMNSTPQRRKIKENLKKSLRLLSAQYAIFLSLRRIYRKEGLSGLYSGLEGEVLKGFLSHGLTMVMKDKVHIGVIQTYYALLKLTKRWPAELEKAKDQAGTMAQDARDRAGSLVQGAKDQAGKASEAVTNGSVVQDVKDRAGSMMQGAKQQAENASGAVSDGTAVQDVKDRASTMMQGAKDQAGKAGEAVTDSSTQVVEEAKKRLGPYGDK